MANSLVFTYAKAYTEVLEIIKFFPEEDKNKIPKEDIEFFEKYSDKDYYFEIKLTGYKKSEVAVDGYNCWVIGNAATNLIEKNGVFYKKDTVMKAMLVTDEFPGFLSGAAIRRNDDGSWTIKTSWGESTGFPGKCYWVLYGINEDGTPDANILTKTEKSFKDYIVCDEDGIDLGWLSELDEIWSTGEQKYILSPDHLRVLVTSGGAKIDRR